jgi:hypothetical protein
MKSHDEKNLIFSHHNRYFNWIACLGGEKVFYHDIGSKNKNNHGCCLGKKKNEWGKENRNA